MFLDKNSIIINNINMGQYITEAKYAYNKLWGADSGRNLNGDMIATLIGIFPKITLEFKPLTKSELEIIIPVLDTPRQTFSYYDPYKKMQTTMTTYTSDYEVSNKNIINNITPNESFNCSFISVSKRV